MAKIKKYSITMDSDVFAVSLVENGAIESDFIYLAKQQPKQVCLEANEKHLVVGAILIPDRPIYRYDEEGEYYISFSKEVIEKLAYDFMKRKLNDSVTLDHEVEANNITLVESWIRTSENDKSVDLGLDAPLGSWIGAMKVEDETTWERIKNQELNGFSVEAFCNLEEFKLSKDMTKDLEINESFWSKLKVILSEVLGDKQEEVTEDKVEEVVEEVVAEVPTDEAVETVEEVIETPTDEVVEEVVEEVAEEIALEEQETKDYEKIIEGLNDELTELKSQIEDLKKVNEKLSKQPSAEPIKVEASAEKKFPSFLDFASGRVKY